MPFDYFRSSIGKKQIVAVTGLMLILFLIGHLAGNLLIYLGPEVFNSYSKHLTDLRPGLYLVEYGLLVIFVIHMWVTTLVVLENIQARQGLARYAVDKAVGKRSWATRLMPYTGTYILFFVIWHLLDFTFSSHEGARSFVLIKNYSDFATSYHFKSLGLYGVVWNSFADPVHSLLYIIAMMCIGLHLSHGVESFIQTFGFNHPKYTPMIKKISEWFGLFIALGYSSIPVYVLINNYLH